MEIYNTKNAKITYHTENNVLVQTINDYLSSNALREFQTEFINICESLKVSKIISDAKKQKVKPILLQNATPVRRSLVPKAFGITTSFYFR